jgi:hypothetical protein
MAPMAENRETTSAPSDILQVDDRLLRLETDSLRYRSHLVKFEDALLGQMVTVTIMQIAFAILIVGLVWENYKKVNSGLS